MRWESQGRSINFEKVNEDGTQGQAERACRKYEHTNKDTEKSVTSTI